MNGWSSRKILALLLSVRYTMVIQDVTASWKKCPTIGGQGDIAKSSQMQERAYSVKKPGETCNLFSDIIKQVNFQRVQKITQR